MGLLPPPAIPEEGSGARPPGAWLFPWTQGPWGATSTASPSGTKVQGLACSLRGSLSHSWRLARGLRGAETGETIKGKTCGQSPAFEVLGLQPAGSSQPSSDRICSSVSSQALSWWPLLPDRHGLITQQHVRPMPSPGPLDLL